LAEARENAEIGWWLKTGSGSSYQNRSRKFFTSGEACTRKRFSIGTKLKEHVYLKIEHIRHAEVHHPHSFHRLYTFEIPINDFVSRRGGKSPYQWRVSEVVTIDFVANHF